MNFFKLIKLYLLINSGQQKKNKIKYLNQTILKFLRAPLNLKNLIIKYFYAFYSGSNPF